MIKFVIIATKIQIRTVITVNVNDYCVDISSTLSK